MRCIINLKAYKESSPKNIDWFLEEIKPLLRNEDRVAIPSIMLYKYSGNKNVISQHVDCDEYGAYTGRIIMDDLVELGINGSLLNHSERPVDMPTIKNCIRKAEKLNFELIVCAKNLGEANKILDAGGKIIAYEPPELIGGDVSVSISKPEIIEKGVTLCERRGADLYIGAGVKTREDVIIASKLGAKGILVSSGVVKSKDPAKSLNSLII
ncbi:triose-phosphate isomerase [Caldiplasma sukawensis]